LVGKGNGPGRGGQRFDIIKRHLSDEAVSIGYLQESARQRKARTGLGDFNNLSEHVRFLDFKTPRIL